MRTVTAWATVLGCCACWLTAGCDAKPGPIRTEGGQIIKLLSVDPDDSAELAAATAMEKARINYHYRLNVLQGYYEQVGVIERYKAAGDELENLQEAQWFEWDGIPEVLPPEGESVRDADERLLVEYVVAARNGYLSAVSELLQLYQRKDRALKARVIQRVEERFDFVQTFAYFPEAEIPGADLRPQQVVPEADAIFEKALKLHRQGKLIPLLPDYQKQRQALRLFLQLVSKHPGSTKIALSAYYIGEIYKEYFNQDLRAVRWYERAWQWDPTITKPARFQAAVVWDLRLHDRDKALELYKKVIEHEQFSQSNVSFAYSRIERLTQQEQGAR